MKVWWLGTARGNGNFGDILTPFILNYFNIKYEYTDHYTNANAISTGSIARRAGKGVKVLGSGIIARTDKLNPNADWKFVRGPYTRERVHHYGGNCPEIYGDPALLLPLMVKPSEKKFEVGIVPHNVDYNYVLENHNNNIIPLSKQKHTSVIDKITQCESIISSSLHGIICAHAYGIPAAWVKPNTKLKGDNVKFEDYFASVNIDGIQSTYDKPVFIDPGTIDLTPIINIFKKQITESN